MGTVWGEFGGVVKGAVDFLLCLSVLSSLRSLLLLFWSVRSLGFIFQVSIFSGCNANTVYGSATVPTVSHVFAADQNMLHFTT
ncbi:hypothetical protein BJ741DRAFT_606553 [Chytriomyces cf. hyalinus JEL632]|nr:hypothetical protein BJ741DRAFT_606553 [Chytriomyces cf. hyalinus JEL632]